MVPTSDAYHISVEWPSILHAYEYIQSPLLGKDPREHISLFIHLLGLYFIQCYENTKYLYTCWKNKWKEKKVVLPDNKTSNISLY